MTPRLNKKNINLSMVICSMKKVDFLNIKNKKLLVVAYIYKINAKIKFTTMYIY